MCASRPVFYLLWEVPESSSCALLLDNSGFVALGILFSTYTREFDTAVTALRRSASLLDVKVSELATGSLDHTDKVRFCVIADEVVSGDARE